MRQDVDPDFRIPDLETGNGIAGRLMAFATRQIGTCPLGVIGTEEERNRLLDEIRSRHPVDTVPHLIWREPMLMLSNLTENQLENLLPELRRGTTKANMSSVNMAVSLIQGILIGKASKR